MSGLIRLIVDGVPIEVTDQITINRHNFSDALRRHNSPHVCKGSQEPIDLIGMFSPGNRVRDVDRYRVSPTTTGYRLVPHPRCEVVPQHNAFKDFLTGATEPGSFAGTVIVILESPHEKEYVDGNVNCPIAPAQGTTGCNIEMLLPYLLSADAIAKADLLVTNINRVIIANPVQFQASLWSIHRGCLEVEGEKLNWRTLRNAVWKTLWSQLEKRNFADRLRTYCPTLILNCCTAELQPLVTDWLRSSDYGPITFTTTHPSAWNVPVVKPCG